MLARCLTAIASLVCIFGTVGTPADAMNTATNPPTSFFQLPASVAGLPAFYEQLAEGGVCTTSNNQCRATSFSATAANCGTQGVPISCVFYEYGATPNIGEPGAAGIYGVNIFTNASIAQRYNRDVRDAAAQITEDAQIAPLLPIAAPVDAATEWLRGVAKKSGTSTLCVAEGGVRYKAITMDAVIRSFRSTTLPGSYPCSAEYHWVTKVLRALYIRAEATHASGSA